MGYAQSQVAPGRVWHCSAAHTPVVSPRRKPELCSGMAGACVFHDLNCVLEFYGVISCLLYIQCIRHDTVATVKL